MIYITLQQGTLSYTWRYTLEPWHMAKQLKCKPCRLKKPFAKGALSYTMDSQEGDANTPSRMLSRGRLVVSPDMTVGDLMKVLELSSQISCLAAAEILNKCGIPCLLNCTFYPSSPVASNWRHWIAADASGKPSRIRSTVCSGINLSSKA